MVAVPVRDDGQRDVLWFEPEFFDGRDQAVLVTATGTPVSTSCSLGPEPLMRYASVK